MAQRNSPIFSLPVSFFLAFMLAMLPLPQALSYWRPEFVTMLLIFWAINAPTLVGVWTGFALGLLLDVLLATPFGVHAMMLSVLAWIIQLFWRQIVVFSLPQTSLLVLVLVFLALLLKRLLLGIVALGPDSLWFWLPALTSALLWPLLLTMMQHFLQRR